MGIFGQVVEFLGPWTWWVFGLLLAGLELVVPGTFFLWFAVAAIVTGTVALMVDVGWQVEMLIFIAVAAVTVFVGRRLYGRAKPDSELQLNDRLARQVGRRATLETAIVDGSGHIRLDDTLWRVSGPALPAGSQVTIVGLRDGRLLVEPS